MVKGGYLVRERLLLMSEVERLRAALDETVAHDQHLETGGRAFGGIFIRHLMDKHPALLEFLKFAPTLSLARAVFGPYVQIRGFTGRVCYPDDPNQETEWHFHQRLVPDPLPPWLARLQTPDVLLYLDDIDDLNGPLCVVPGSHEWLEVDQPANDFRDLPGQVVLSPIFQERLIIAEWALAGQSDPEIAAALGRSVWTVRKWRRIGQRRGCIGLTSRMGRPATGPLSTSSPALRDTILQLRRTHPG